MSRVEQSSNSTTFFLSGELGIYQAEIVFNELAPLICQAQKLIIDLSEVSDIDSSIVQLLILTRKERDHRGLQLSLMNHSKTVINVFERLGLLAWFNDPVLLSGNDFNTPSNNNEIRHGG